MTKPDANPVYGIIGMRTGQASVLALALHWLFHWPLTGPHALGLVFTPLLCLYFVFVFVAPWRWGLPLLTRLPTEERVVALTFDDGPSPETTPQILDILRDHGIKVTFFVLGEAAGRHPELIRRIVQEGHTVGLHGFHHRALVLASAKTLQAEITQASAAVRQACPDAAPTLFRPPHGFKTLLMPFQVRRRGYRLVLWSLDPGDYRGRTAPQLAETFRAALHPGAVCLLHDGPASVQTVEALPLMLAEIAEKGYRCVTLETQG